MTWETREAVRDYLICLALGIGGLFILACVAAGLVSIANWLGQF